MRYKAECLEIRTAALVLSVGGREYDGYRSSR